MNKRNNVHTAPEPDTISALKDLEQALVPPGLGATRPGTRKDPVTAMLARKDFLPRLEQEIRRASAPSRPLALALFEINDMDGMKRACAEVLLRTLCSRLWDSAQKEDTLGRLDDNLLAFILPGSGHFHALALTESVVNDVWIQYSGLGLEPFTLKASVAAPDIREAARTGAADDVMDRARLALTLASSAPEAQVRERVKLYRKDDVPEERETLVLANEKQFLFFGGI